MSGFKYPRSFGFTGSADRKEGRVPVSGHTRKAPSKRPLTPTEREGIESEQRPRPRGRAAQLRDQERRLGLKKGGKVKRDC